MTALSARCFASLALLATLLGCAPALPDYAQPRVETLDPSTQLPADTIAYRTLTRADFRATRPPAHVGEHAARMGAYTCGHLIPANPVQIRIEPEGGAFVAHAVDFDVHARMDRSCSWWNGAMQTEQSPAYVLQHEQIHFALFELAARDMARRGRALVARGATIEDARARFQRALDALQRDSASDLLRRNQDFDRDTSGVHRPDVQQRWFDRVSAELTAEVASAGV